MIFVEVKQLDIMYRSCSRTYKKAALWFYITKLGSRGLAVSAIINGVTKARQNVSARTEIARKWMRTVPAPPAAAEGRTFPVGHGNCVSFSA